MKISINKQLISFKLCANLSSVMKARAVWPAWDMSHPFASVSESLHLITQASCHLTSGGPVQCNKVF